MHDLTHAAGSTAAIVGGLGAVIIGQVDTAMPAVSNYQAGGLVFAAGGLITALMAPWWADRKDARHMRAEALQKDLDEQRAINQALAAAIGALQAAAEVTTRTAGENRALITKLIEINNRTTGDRAHVVDTAEGRG